MKCSICGGNNVYWSDYWHPRSVCPDCGATYSEDGIQKNEDKQERFSLNQDTDGRCTFDE